MGLIDTVFRKARRFVHAVRDRIIPPPLPENVIDVRLDEMRATLARCRSRLDALEREQRDLQQKVHHNAKQITHHLREARLASARGEHEIAREHLHARARHEQVATTLGTSLHEFRQATDRLFDQVRALEMQVEESRRRKQLLVAQRECIHAHLLLCNAPAAGGTVGDLMEDMEQEIGRIQAVAHLTAPLSLPFLSPECTLSDELTRRRVDDELDHLKRQLALCTMERERARPVVSLTEDEEILFIS